MNLLYAFWKYDSFPFVLGGEVINMDKDGRVQTKEYGPWHWYKPIKLLPLESGRELHNKLLDVQHEYFRVRKEMGQEWFEKLKALAPDLYDK